MSSSGVGNSRSSSHSSYSRTSSHGASSSGVGNSRSSSLQESGSGEGNSRTSSRAATNAEEREAAAQLSQEVADDNMQKQAERKEGRWKCTKRPWNETLSRMTPL